MKIKLIAIYNKKPHYEVVYDNGKIENAFGFESVKEKIEENIELENH